MATSEELQGWIEATTMLAEESQTHRARYRKSRFKFWQKKAPSSTDLQIQFYEVQIQKLQAAIRNQDEARRQTTNWVARSWLACTQSLSGYRVDLEYYREALIVAKMQHAYHKKNWHSVIQLHVQQAKSPQFVLQQKTFTKHLVKLVEPGPSWFARLTKQLKRLGGMEMPIAKIEELNLLLKPETHFAYPPILLS